MTPTKKTADNLKLLVLLEYEQELTIEKCAEILKVSDRTLYTWRKSDEYKVALAEYVSELEEEAVPRSLTLLLRLAKQGHYHAAVTLMQIYKGTKTKLEGDLTVAQFVRHLVNGSNGRESPDDS